MLRAMKVAVVMTVAFLCCGFVMVKHDLTTELEVVPGVLPAGEHMAVFEGKRFTFMIKPGSGPTAFVEGREAKGETESGEALALRMPGLPAGTYVLGVRTMDRVLKRFFAHYTYMFVQVRKGDTRIILPLAAKGFDLPGSLKARWSTGRFDFYGLADPKDARAYLSDVWMFGDNGKKLINIVVTPLP